jgi:uncharacterized protein YjdB
VATITATASDGSGITATCTVTVNPVPVASIGLNKPTLTLEAAQTETLVATVLPANATNKAVTWESTAPAIATVDANGKVTAVSVGVATITATASDGSKTATCEVAVTQPVSSITLSDETLALMIGQETTLTATVAPDNASNKTINWASSAQAVATVVDGKVVAISAGSATITATAADGSGVSATCIVTVTAPSITSVTVAPTTAAVRQGETQQFTAEVVKVGEILTTVAWSIAGQAKDATSIDAGGMLTVAIDETSATLTITATATADKKKLGTAIVIVERATGIGELIIPDLKVYPNPYSSGPIRISGAAGCTLKVFNATGVVLYTQEIVSPDETLQLEHLPAGVYFFRLEKDGKAKTVKTVKN